MMQLQLPQLQIEDIASILQLAKTAKIEAADAIAVGSLIERVEMVLAIGKLQRGAQPQPGAPAPGTPDAPPAATETPKEAPAAPSKIDKAVRSATAPTGRET